MIESCKKTFKKNNLAGLLHYQREFVVEPWLMQRIGASARLRKVYLGPLLIDLSSHAVIPVSYMNTRQYNWQLPEKHK